MYAVLTCAEGCCLLAEFVEAGGFPEAGAIAVAVIVVGNRTVQADGERG